MNDTTPQRVLLPTGARVDRSLIHLAYLLGCGERHDFDRVIASPLYCKGIDIEKIKVSGLPAEPPDLLDSYPYPHEPPHP